MLDVSGVFLFPIDRTFRHCNFLLVWTPGTVIQLEVSFPLLHPFPMPRRTSMGAKDLVGSLNEPFIAKAILAPLQMIHELCQVSLKNDFMSKI